MFEKDAEEYLKVQCQKRKEEYVIRMPEVYIADIPQAFKAGAEFGYNKAREELEEKYKETFCNSELNLASVTKQLEELENANKWHYVEDGDLPKHNHEVLCLMWGGTKEIGYYENEVWHFENFVADYEDVDYWQEIVPPKESE